METPADPAQRVAALLDLVESVRSELSRPETNPDTGLAAAKVPPEQVRQLKTSVDQFRLFLWAYLDTWAESGANPELHMRNIRMQCAADMLTLLVNDFRAGGIPPTNEAFRLGEQVHAIATLMMGPRDRQNA